MQVVVTNHFTACVIACCATVTCGWFSRFNAASAMQLVSYIVQGVLVCTWTGTRTVAFSVPLLLQPLLVCWVCIGEMLCGHLFCWLVKHTRAGHLRVEVADGASGEVCRQRQVGGGGGG
jgi:hypothetical protein